MMRYQYSLLKLAPAVLLSLSLPAQTQNTNSPEQPFLFKVDVVSRTTKAINFHHRQGSTVMTLQGTEYARKSRGEVRVDSRTGATKIDASVERLPPAS